MNPAIVIAMIVVGGILLTVGDVVLNNWIQAHGWKYFFIGEAFYIIATVILALSFKYKNVAVATLMGIMINIVTLVAFNYFFLHYKMSFLQMAGAGLGVVAFIMLELG